MGPVWLDRDAVMRAHDEVVVLTGGASGVRDAGLLDSVLARPENVHAYEGQADIVVLAATYAVAFVGMAIFLGRNGLRLTASQAGATATMLSVAAGTTDIEALAAWLRDNTVAR